jgi:hypothetical protein
VYVRWIQNAATKGERKTLQSQQTGDSAREDNGLCSAHFCLVHNVRDIGFHKESFFIVSANNDRLQYIVKTVWQHVTTLRACALEGEELHMNGRHRAVWKVVARRCRVGEKFIVWKLMAANLIGAPPPQKKKRRKRKMTQM